MSDDLQLRFDAARADTEAVTLAEPATLRHIGTRRNSVRFLATAATVVVAVVALALGANRLLLTSSPQLPTGGTPSGPSLVTSSPTSAVSPTPDPSEPDVTGYEEADRACSTSPANCYDNLGEGLQERLPAPCGAISHPSDASIVERKSEQLLVGSNAGLTATTYARTATRYRDGGAASYLDEVRDALRRCASVRRDGMVYRYKLVGSIPGGDESVLLTKSYRGAIGGQQGNQTYLIAVIRVGDVVAVVYDFGWEGASVSRAQFNGYVSEALARVRAGAP